MVRYAPARRRARGAREGDALDFLSPTPPRHGARHTITRIADKGNRASDYRSSWAAHAALASPGAKSGGYRRPAGNWSARKRTKTATPSLKRAAAAVRPHYGPMPPPQRNAPKARDVAQCAGKRGARCDTEYFCGESANNTQTTFVRAKHTPRRRSEQQFYLFFSALSWLGNSAFAITPPHNERKRHDGKIQAAASRRVSSDSDPHYSAKKDAASDNSKTGEEEGKGATHAWPRRVAPKSRNGDATAEPASWSVPRPAGVHPGVRPAPPRAPQ